MVTPPSALPPNSAIIGYTIGETLPMPQLVTLLEKYYPFQRFGLQKYFSAKPVLNRANVCSPNILRTVRRTMIRFLIELSVRRTWFGQFDELYFVLNWLVMRCKLRPELAYILDHAVCCASAASQCTLIILHRVTTILFWVPETRSRLSQINK